MAGIETVVRRNLVKSLVQRAILCRYTGALLDMDTCAVIVDRDGDPHTVVSPSAADLIEANEDAMRGLADGGYAIVRGGRSAF